ncbi:ATP-dependent DNA helicase [Frankliniella fusca]|uniref:ATP-dependent DNA helicase n=1 Tax=Frankliniella fusca TaxID=407009 RepID=A0AAE1HN05_9NEOP|nr:ATP-dependent DNA helicase [Frankliniella fusca]
MDKENAPDSEKRKDRKTEEKLDTKSASTSNAKRCKRYRDNLSEEKRKEMRQKDILRKRQKAKGKSKGRKEELTRLNNNQTCNQLPKKGKVQQEQLENCEPIYRLIVMSRQNKKIVSVKEKFFVSDVHDPDIDTENSNLGETDRTYLLNRMRKHKENLLKYNVNNCRSLFGKLISDIKWHKCELCNARNLGLKLKCYCNKGNSILKSQLMELGDVPPVLSCLSQIEQLLIARVHPVVQVYRLRGGQIGYSGHVINFFQDITEFTKTLPHSIEDISGVVKVCCQTPSFHKDFTVRKRLVLEALQWLKENNPHYFDVEVNSNVLEHLPDDYQFNIIENISSDNEPSIIGHNETEENAEDHISSSSIPQVNMMSAEEKLRFNLKWPTISHSPIAEMSRSHYIVKAFPCLFPYGKGDICDIVNEKISHREYFQYLMDYFDGRFASHTIFPYFAWNSVMRWECLTKGTVYMKKHPDLKKCDVDLLKELMKLDTNVGKDVMVYSSSIRSTRNFWFSRSAELQEMVQQIGLPTIFFTLSAADFHWPRLFDLLKEAYGLVNVNEQERHKLMFENPKICSDYFFALAETFINDILLVYFNVKDHWYRYEWQLRGSPHVHGVLWFAGAVNVKELQVKFNEVKQQIIEYFDKFISCINPNTNYVITSEHPCRTRIEDVVDYHKHIEALVNTVQRHTKKYYEFVGARNDDRLNQFSEFVLGSWTGNHDLTAILSEGGFSHYISKYATKPESKSTLNSNLFMKVIEKSSGTTTVKSAVQQTLMSALIQRDYSAQEVHHLLAGNKLYSCSRSFVTLNLADTEWFYHINLEKLETDIFNENCNQLFSSYSKRPASLKKVSLYDFLRLFNTKTYQKKRGRPSIIRIFPKIKDFDSDSTETSEEIARQLCLLYCPWQELNELPKNGLEWIAMMQKHKLDYKVLPYFKEELKFDATADESDDEDCGVNDKAKDDWMEIMDIDINAPQESDLGLRDMDISFDWKCYKTTNEQEIIHATFVKTHRENFQKVKAVLPAHINFTPEQNKILEFADNLAEHFNVHGNFGQLPKYMVCQANAGCGKTITIQGLVHLVSAKCGEDKIIVIAPTAAAALNAGGRTIHSMLRISVGRDKHNGDLSGEFLHNFQQTMRNVHFVVIEEFSMVGCNMFSLINRRCMQFRNSTEIFGGCAIFLFGDAKQLQPVADVSLFKTATNKMKPNALDGCNLFHCVEEVKVLKTCHRQSNVSFCEFLEHISHGYVTDVDKELISVRFEENMPIQDREKFHDAIHLFTTRKGVDDFNEHVVKSMNIPVLKIPSENNSDLAAACSDEVASYLRKNLCLGIGVRVMLRANLWTDAGLVNGAFGTVKHIVFNKGNDTKVPDYILVKFDNFKGPTVEDECVPIARTLRSWYMKDVYCTRIQFPLDLSYAVTFHKSQGLTIPKVVVHIQEKERQPGMYYVALSRVRDPSDLMIVGPYKNSPLFQINMQMYLERNESVKWLLSKASKCKPPAGYPIPNLEEKILGRPPVALANGAEPEGPPLRCSGADEKVPRDPELIELYSVNGSSLGAPILEIKILPFQYYVGKSREGVMVANFHLFTFGNVSNDAIIFLTQKLLYKGLRFLTRKPIQPVWNDCKLLETLPEFYTG